MSCSFLAFLAFIGSNKADDKNSLKNSVGFGRMSSESVIKVIHTIIGTQSNIEKLNLQGNNLNDACVVELSKYVCGNSRLTELNIQKNHDITDQSVQSLALMIQISNISDLLIDGTSITDKYVLVPYLEINKMKKGTNSLWLNK